MTKYHCQQFVKIKIGKIALLNRWIAALLLNDNTLYAYTKERLSIVKNDVLDNIFVNIIEF